MLRGVGSGVGLAPRVLHGAGGGDRLVALAGGALVLMQCCVMMAARTVWQRWRGREAGADALLREDGGGGQLQS